MNVLDKKRDAESSAEIAVVSLHAFHSVERYVASFLAITSKKAANSKPKPPKADLDTLFLEVTKSLGVLEEKVSAIKSPEVKEMVKVNLAPELISCMSLFNEAEKLFESAEFKTSLLSREDRRRLEKEFREVERGYRGGEIIAEYLVKIMEILDSSTDDYLEKELSGRYGDNARDVLSAFSRIGQDGAISAEEFKKRYSEG